MKYRLEDVVDVTMGQSPKSEYYNSEGKGTPFLQGNRTFGFKRPTFDTYTTLVTKSAKAGDVIMSVRAPVGDLNITPIDMCLGRGVCSLRMKNGNQEFLYYMMKYYMPRLINKESGTVFGSVNRNDINGLEIDIPSDTKKQQRIARYLTMIDDKIELNTAINKNLEQQLTDIFVHSFSNQISALDSDNCPKLGDLISVIDNRGKTPPLITEMHNYPIIDVGALRGDGRIINFDNCTKFVNKSTYETWFRSGHPQPWDILLSTVGSLAEMKIYLGNKGCIAQNVVALRATKISPLYLYQYLQHIKPDLVAYNIGSVQPSIKITHIIKHPIFVPSADEINKFDEVATATTQQLFNNYKENEALVQLRDTLLPKLLSGELDVSSIDL